MLIMLAICGQKIPGWVGSHVLNLVCTAKIDLKLSPEGLI